MGYVAPPWSHPTHVWNYGVVTDKVRVCEDGELNTSSLDHDGRHKSESCIVYSCDLSSHFPIFLFPPRRREFFSAVMSEPRHKFKETCLVRQTLSGQAPLYTHRWLLPRVRQHSALSIHGHDVPTFWRSDVVPRTLSSYSDRTFVAASPRLWISWNSLPVQLRNPDITDYS